MILFNYGYTLGLRPLAQEALLIAVCSRSEWHTAIKRVFVKGGTTSSKPNQVHHYATNKSKTYTQQFEDITNKYGLNLNDEWNKELLPHQGRHPNAYHEFILDEMTNIDNIANGDVDIFLDLYESNVRSVVRDNPDMLYKNYWQNK